MVQDMQTGQKWHFLCNSWLSIDLEECILDKVFPVATEMDLKRFRYVAERLFGKKYMWYKIMGIFSLMFHLLSLNFTVICSS